MRILSGTAYTVVFPDGAGFNPGDQIAKPEEYPGINQDYRDTLHFLESLRPDIWPAHHTEYFDLEGRRTRAGTEGVKGWVDPEGYRRWSASKRRAFEDEVDLEMGVKNPKQASVRSRLLPVAVAVAVCAFSVFFSRAAQAQERRRGAESLSARTHSTTLGASQSATTNDGYWKQEWGTGDCAGTRVGCWSRVSRSTSGCHRVTRP